MYDVDSTIKTLALKPARHIWCAAIMGARSGNTWTNDRTYYDNDYVVSAVVDIGAQNGGLQIGNAYCAKLTLTLLDGATVAQTDRIIMRVGFYNGTTKSDAISLGWFYVDTIKKSGKTITVTAYDKMLRAQKNYVSALTYPALLSDVLAEITDKMNVNMSSDFSIPYDGQITAAPTKGNDADGNPIYYTRRGILGYIASLCGGNFYFDVGGHLAMSRFAAVTDTFAAANSMAADISADAFTVSGISWVVNGVSCSRADVDTTGIVEFTNVLPLAAKEPFLHAVETRVVGLTYHGGTITRQGCGWFEIGDIVTAQRANGTTANVLITGINYNISGGAFTEKIYASAMSDSECNYTTGDVTGQQVPQSVGGEPSGGGTAEKLQTSGSTVCAYTDSSGGLMLLNAAKFIFAMLGENGWRDGGWRLGGQNGMYVETSENDKRFDAGVYNNRLMLDDFGIKITGASGWAKIDMSTLIRHEICKDGNEISQELNENYYKIRTKNFNFSIEKNSNDEYVFSFGGHSYTIKRDYGSVGNEPDSSNGLIFSTDYGERLFITTSGGTSSGLYVNGKKVMTEE